MAVTRIFRGNCSVVRCCVLRNWQRNTTSYIKVEDFQWTKERVAAFAPHRAELLGPAPFHQSEKRCPRPRASRCLFVGVFQRVQLHEGRPKQKRHRCRNPNKLDISSLTGEERVQLINRRNARKVRGPIALPGGDAFSQAVFSNRLENGNLAQLQEKTYTIILCRLISNPTSLTASE